MVTITVYGGVAGDDETGEIGGNKILLEFDGHAYFLDFGKRFSVSNRYFGEFQQPRPSAGLRDYARMELIPPLEGLYREDLFSHEPGFWDQYRAHPHYRRLERLDGILLSHAHVDHSGAIGFIRPEIPIFTGLMTAVIGKAMEDIRGIGPENEFSYVAPREATPDGLLKVARGPRIGRPHLICETDASTLNSINALNAFWGSVPQKTIDIQEKPLTAVDPSEYDLRFFRVGHSIPGSGAFALETPIGWIVYTGDL